MFNAFSLKNIQCICNKKTVTMLISEIQYVLTLNTGHSYLKLSSTGLFV